MTKLALVDLDGTIANRDAREAKAREIAEEWLAEHRHGNVILKEYGSPGSKDIYRQAFFNPEYVPLDTLIEGTRESLMMLVEQGFIIIYLTSRPESMRETTLTWLDQQNLFCLGGWEVEPYAVVMKPSAFQDTETPVWKAGMVQTLTFFHAATEVLYVDDREENVEAVVEVWEEMPARLHTWSSLKLALAIRNWEEWNGRSMRGFLSVKWL